MMNPMEMKMAPQPRRSSVMLPLGIGLGAFLVGAVATFGYVQWQSQQQKLAEMAQTLEKLQSGETVTRAAPADLLSLAVAPSAAPAEPTVAPTPASLPADPQPVAAAPSANDALAKTTAERIRDLVARSTDPLVSNAIADDVARRETMSIAIQGVNELVDAAVAGRYTINNSASDGSGRLGIVFLGQEELQAELENLLSTAAAADMISYADYVRSSDNTFNGEIILFDLVERALLNGTEAERKTGLEIGQKARSVAASSGLQRTQVTQEDGQRYYVVEKGDSLAYIALQFYGETNAYRQIFDANRDRLSSPERIQVGQRLLIPNLG